MAWAISVLQSVPGRKAMARTKKGKQIYSTKLVQLKKMTPRIKTLGKRAAKTSAVKA
jgi:hypothetical protein